MAACRIFIADDHEVVRKGLCALLQGESGWEVCGEASDGRTATEKVRELKPDVIVLDIGMPGLNGLEATRQIIKDDAASQGSDSDFARFRSGGARSSECGSSWIPSESPTRRVTWWSRSKPCGATKLISPPRLRPWCWKDT